MSKSKRRATSEDEVDDFLEDTSTDVILDMYEEDIECDMDCASCTNLERQECVREMKQALLVTIQKLNNLYRDFNLFSRKIYKLLNVSKYIEQLKESGEFEESDRSAPEGIFT
ncbi:MAG: hypothetical protein ACTSU5_08635 [Promethearchaeota archaeon]